jgi:hypothetical protein
VHPSHCAKCRSRRWDALESLIDGPTFETPKSKVIGDLVVTKVDIPKKTIYVAPPKPEVPNYYVPAKYRKGKDA